jgi:DNA mismatch repair protein MutL
MLPIRLLDPHIVNQISAGEVVERPASVLKELMENAIDAGAQKIVVRWRQGGQSLIEVQDDGCGIPKEQMRMALARHATSKLSAQEDLHTIGTFGFRGEALAAMASISRLTLSSRQADESHGWSLSVHGGQEIELCPCNREQGTSVQVRDLFFATPARLKFMRSAALEQNYLWDAVHKIVLAHPEIAFSVHSDTRSVDYGVGLEKRLHDVLGQGFCENSFYLDTQRDGYRLTGWVGLPTYHRAASDKQFYFVNARAVKDTLLALALRLAFTDTMPKGRHPVGALFLTLPLADVDVNVHPAKSEVRFLDPRFVRGFVLTVVKEAVWTNGLRASTWSDSEHASGADQASDHAQDNPRHQASDHQQGCAQSQSQSQPQHNAQSQSQSQPQHNAQESVVWPSQSQSWNVAEAKSDIVPSGQVGPMLGPMLHTVKPIYDPTIAREQAYFMPKGTAQMPLVFQKEEGAPVLVDLGQALGQIQDSYIVARAKDGLVLIDPHAAHERIVYEYMKTQWAQNVGHILTFLIPVSWAITPCQHDGMVAAKDVMKTLGFAYELTPLTVRLTSVPMIFQAYDPQSLVVDLMTCIQDGDEAQDVVLAWRNHMMANWACRQSIKLGQHLTIDAMNTLLRRLERTPHGAQCNHGRCVYRILRTHDLARLFDR